MYPTLCPKIGRAFPPTICALPSLLRAGSIAPCRVHCALIAMDERAARAKGISMALLEWKAELELGEPTMDATHREYAELLNRLEHAADGEFLGHLDAFIGHTERHFADENEKMAATKLPPAGCHLHEHEQVLLIMKDVRVRVAAGEVYLGRVLAGEMGKWFENHAATMDRMLAYWLLVGDEGRAQLLAEAQAAQHAHACGTHGSACSHAEHAPVPEAAATDAAGARA